MNRSVTRYSICIMLLLCTSIGFAQVPNVRSIEIQKEKLSVLDRLDGQWRGTATIQTPDGQSIKLTQTERVGAMLDGVVKMVEGSGYDPQGSKQFNALGIFSYNTETNEYQMRSYAMGRTGDFTVEITNSGFQWEIPAGPMTIRYTAKITDSTWHEVGQRIVEGQPPATFIEMNLKKVGETEWPAGNPVRPQ